MMTAATATASATTANKSLSKTDEDDDDERRSDRFPRIVPVVNGRVRSPNTKIMNPMHKPDALMQTRLQGIMNFFKHAMDVVKTHFAHSIMKPFDKGMKHVISDVLPLQNADG